MEPSDELGKGFLRPFQQVDASSPFFATRNKLTNEFVGQVLKTGYAPLGLTIEPRLRYPL